VEKIWLVFGGALAAVDWLRSVFVAYKEARE